MRPGYIVAGKPSGLGIQHLFRRAGEWSLCGEAVWLEVQRAELVNRLTWICARCKAFANGALDPAPPRPLPTVSEPPGAATVPAMIPAWSYGDVAVHLGDALEVLAGLPDASVDAVVTDPPAGISFMGRSWDHDHGGREGWVRAYAAIFREVLRVLKPGAHGFVWAIPRTSHWTATALEDAGFEVRDVVHHHFGSGFPKSLDVSKAIDRQRHDKEAMWAVAEWLRPHVERVGFDVVTAHFGFTDDTMARWRWTSRSATHTPSWEQWLALKELCGFGDEMDAEVRRLNGRKGQPGETWQDREVIGRGHRVHGESTVQVAPLSEGGYDVTAAASEAAREWEGWGTALKPATEHWILVRTPPAGPNVAANVLVHGTGALNIDACRIHTAGSEAREYTVTRLKPGATLYATGGNWRPEEGGIEYHGETTAGRWPANLVLSHTESCRPVGTRGPEPIEVWDCADDCPVAELDRQSGVLRSGFMAAGTQREGLGYRGGLGSRVRNDTIGDSGSASRFFYVPKASTRERNEGLPPGRRNTHPTVKPLALMRWLCRLITPPKGVILDPFMGSGTTGCAAVLEGFGFIGVEQDEESVSTAIARLQHWLYEPGIRAQLDLLESVL